VNVLSRDHAPFSGRVWPEIDGAVAGIREANCTARRFLCVDGPYGLGLTSLDGDDRWLDPVDVGPTDEDWDVPRAVRLVDPKADPDQLSRRGTYLVQAQARPVALLTSEFILGVRNVEAFDDDCQPLDVNRATRAARDIALEEERLLYYGADGHTGLLNPYADQDTPIADPADPAVVLAQLQQAIQALARRGFAGPFALAVAPELYTTLFSYAGDRSCQLIDALSRLFGSGIHMVPVIRTSAEETRLGVIVTATRAYVRLVVGQDWVTAYRGLSGVYHRFNLLDSLRLEISEPRSLQLLVRPAK
jgi:uncharacterized linocin/CFP29 family protein